MDFIPDKTILQELSQTFTNTAPYMLLSKSNTNPLYLLLFPILLKYLISIIKKMYRNIYNKSDFYLEIVEKPKSHRFQAVNPIFTAINWYLIENYQEIAINDLVCDDYLICEYNENNQVLNTIPVYSLNSTKTSKQISYNFQGTEIKINCGVQINCDKEKTKVINLQCRDLLTMKDFLSFCEQKYIEYKKTQIHGFYQFNEWNDIDRSWDSTQIKTVKSFSNIFLQKKLKDKLKNTLDTFVSLHDKYKTFGIPYKVGFLFHGEPGCGKTSTIYAIAHDYRRNIYNVKLSSFKSGEKLKQAVNLIPDNSLILFEDFDTDSSSHSRAPGNKLIKKGGKFETLLELFDGYNCLHGSIIICTTNHPDKLDDALIRPGRIDQNLLFGPLTKDVVDDILGYFFPNETVPRYSIPSEMSSAHLINHLILPNLNSFEQVMAALQ